MKAVVVLTALALCAAQSFAETHTVTFRRMNGTVLSKIEVAHGANATGQMPEIPSETGMVTQRWDCAEKLANVTNDVTCWALYEASTAKSPSTSIASQTIAYRETPYSLDEYFQMYGNLAWSDEFSGSSLDVGTSTWWGGSTGGNWQYDLSVNNSEVETYTRGENHEVSDGTLKLVCRRESATKITSGRINSKDKVQFKCGRCEIRAKITKEFGAFPAFWLMGTAEDARWPWCGELDIMEQVNGYEWIAGTLHIPQFARSTGNQAVYSNQAIAGPEDGVRWGDGFHRIGVIISERELVWYVDDHIFLRQDIRDSRYDIIRDYGWYIILNYAFGSGWTGVTTPDDERIANFVREDFEIDYCRIFTNTTADNAVVRTAEPDDARLSGPVKATIWRGWQMSWGKPGANYYQDHLRGSENEHVRRALREYLGRDGADIVMFHPRMVEHTGNVPVPFDVPGYSAMGLSSLGGMATGNGTANEKMRSTVLFNAKRFSRSDSSISTLPLSSDKDFTNCTAVVAEFIENDTGAKVKVVSAYVARTNGVENASGVVGQGFSTLMSRLDAMKNDKVILLLEGEELKNWDYIDKRVNSELKPSFSKLGQYTSASPAYQSAWVTANYAASAENPAPLTLGSSNVYTNQSYCATVQFEAPPQVEYGPLDMSGFAKKMTVTFGGAQPGATLVDFPVLVKLSTAINGFSYSDFRLPDGGDLRFADSSGNLVPHEIDTWNPSGVSTVWVKVPSLTKDATITACWGCANPPEVAAKDVWDENYVGVWHLGGGSTTMKESTLVTSDLTASGTGMDLAAAGIVGGAVDFKEYNKGRKLVAPDHDALDGFSACTLEAWTYQTNQNQNAGILSKRTGYNNNVSYQMYDSGNGSPSVVLTMGTNSTSGISTGASLSPALSQWNHLVYTFNSGTITGYKNGTAGTTKSFPKSTVLAGTGKLCVGGFDASDARNFPGKIDEVRISKVARSAAWVKATHDTIADDAFATYAVEGAEPVEPDRILYVNVAAGVTNTLNAALVTSYITNIVKQGSGTLVASAIPSYTGDFTLEGGVFNVGVKNGAGKDKYANTIYVGPGASLQFSGTANNIMDGKKLVFEGTAATTAPGGGKFFNTGGWSTIGTNMTFSLKSDVKFSGACWNRMIVKNAVFDMGGHDLSLSCAPGNQIEFSSTTFRNPGNIVALSGMAFVQGSGHNVYEAPGSGAGEIRLMNNASYNGSGTVSASAWTIVATNSGAKVVANTNRFPGDSVNAMWNGAIVFGRNSSAAFVNYNGGSGSSVLSNTVFNVKGPVSGSGKLTVGPGWLNLHTSDNNTYSGSVTVRGKTIPGSSTIDYPILPGGGGIGLWNGAACFPSASSVTFTNTARLAFMDNTACTVPSVTFVALAGETQSISGGVYTARSTIAGITKTGAGTLIVDSPAQITGLADVQAGTLKIAYSAPVDATQEGVLAPQPQFASLKFASGTTFDLSDNVGFVIVDLDGSPSVTNSGLFGITGKWTLKDPTDKLTVAGQNAMFGEQSAAGCLAFQGATFEIPSDMDAAFVAAAESNGGKIEVARANWVVSQLDESTTLPMPTASSTTNPRWSMAVGPDGQSVLLVLAPEGGYAAWVAEKGIEGLPDVKYNGIERGVRYAFDIAPESATVGDPIIQVVRDANGNPSVQSRDLATGRDDVTFGVLATPDLTDWSNAVLVPMKKFTTDGLWRPTASESSGYVFPSQMFFKYTIDIQE